MTKFAFKILSALFISAVIIAFGTFIFQQKDSLSELFSLSFSDLFLIIILSLFAFTVRGFINKTLYQSVGANITIHEGFSLAIINTVGNILPLSGGLAAKGMYLKQNHHLSYTRYLSATTALFILFASISGIIGAVSIVLLFYYTEILFTTLLIGFICLNGTLVIFLIPLPKLNNQRLNNLLLEAQKGWHVIAQNHMAAIQLASLHTISNILIAGRLLIVFNIFSQDIHILHTLTFSSASILTSLINIAPGGFGVREGIVGGLSSVMGFDLGVGALATLLDRVAGITIAGVTLLILLPFFPHLNKQPVSPEHQNK